MGGNHDTRLTRHLQRLRVLVAERPAWFLVRVRRIMGAFPIRTGDENGGEATPSPIGPTIGPPERRRGGRVSFPPVRFSGLQARSIGSAFGELARKTGLHVWACAVLPDHVHLVLARHHYHIEQIVNLLKGEATRRLLSDGLHPFAALTPQGTRPPKCWQRGQWKVFLDSEADMLRAIRYVEGNPAKEGKPPQRWSFVTPAAAERAPLSGRG